jgi:uncharacterized protein DUF541/lectin-like protein
VLCLPVALGLICASLAAQGGVGQPMVNPANGHTYYLSSTPLDENAALALAKSLGGYMVAVNDAAEDAWLTATFPANGELTWIGLRRPAAGRNFTKWDSGEPLTYTNWAPGEPGSGEECFVHRNWSQPGLWNDISGGTYWVIVEIGTDHQVHPGITVVGTGEATDNADVLEYGAMLVASGATTADAMTEYDRAVQRISKALGQLDVKGLAFEMRGMKMVCLSDEQFRQRQRQGMDSGRAVNKCEIMDLVTIRVPIGNLDAKAVQTIVMAVLGAAEDLSLDQPDVRRINDYFGRASRASLPDDWIPGISYVLRDSKKSYADATKRAFEDARAQAGTQVKITGGKLGAIVDVESSGGGTDRATVRDLHHRVVLRVRFALAQ